MQDKIHNPVKKGFGKRLWLPFISWGIAIALVGTLVILIRTSEWSFWPLPSGGSPLWLVLAIVLMPLNLALEVWKWKSALSPWFMISWKKAWMGILSGRTLAFITPHGLGDYPGRIWFIENNERWKGLGAVLICRVAQFYPTLYFGTIGIVWYLFLRASLGAEVYLSLAWSILLHTLVFMLLFMYYKPILSFCFRLPFLNNWSPYFEIVLSYPRSQINGLLGKSFLRYGVFTIQFIALLNYFAIDLHVIDQLMGSLCTFVLQSTGWYWSPIASREAAVWTYFQEVNVWIGTVFYASMSLWFLNRVIPAFLGMACIFALNKKNE